MFNCFDTLLKASQENFIYISDSDVGPISSPNCTQKLEDGTCLSSPIDGEWFRYLENISSYLVCACQGQGFLRAGCLKGRNFQGWES